MTAWTAQFAFLIVQLVSAARTPAPIFTSAVRRRTVRGRNRIRGFGWVLRFARHSQKIAKTRAAGKRDHENFLARWQCVMSMLATKRWNVAGFGYAEREPSRPVEKMAPGICRRGDFILYAPLV
jgi:hypothetical protein